MPEKKGMTEEEIYQGLSKMVEEIDVNKETLRFFLERLEREGKVICNLERIVGEDPTTKEPVDMVIIKTCPKK